MRFITSPAGKGYSMKPSAVLLGLLLALPAALIAAPAQTVLPLAVPGLQQAHLAPAHWISSRDDPDRVILSSDRIAAQNARMIKTDPSILNLQTLPPRLNDVLVRTWISSLAVLPDRPLFNESGQMVTPEELAQIRANLALDSIPARQVARYGMVVRRAALRTLPTRLRVFSSVGDTDIDRFQESALFPGDPVVVAHESRDGQWFFVVSERYSAWIEREYIGEGTKDDVLHWGQRRPYLIVTGATASTVHTPETPAVSDVQLEMGVRVPVRADWSPTEPVNGQLPAASHVIDLPVRGEDGQLSFAAALIPRSADVASDYLPLTSANLIRQSFKFLGERYGWGHSYNARDCSGFVSEIYRSFGVLLPRNTGAQATSPALNGRAFDITDNHQSRLQAVKNTQPGDLVYIPGHVMLVIGDVDGQPYAIHDTSAMSWLPTGSDVLSRLPLNGVVVTPILPMMSSMDAPVVDRITVIKQIRP